MRGKNNGRKMIIPLLIIFSLISVFLPTEIATANPGNISFQFSLNEGWNLITIPVENNYLASDLAENISGCSMISWFDAEFQILRTYIVGVPAYDFPIQDGFGLFVLLENDTEFTVEGEELTGITIDLVEGFNLLGWYESSSNTASSIFNSIAGCINVSVFDAVNQVDKSYRSPSDPDFVISRGMGYWVEINYDFQIDFYAGYNLITIPLENDYMASTLAAEIPGCEYISMWNQNEESYHSYIVGGPESFDFPIEDGVGYYVVVTDDTSVTFNGIPLSSASVTIQDGYNHLGWYDTEDTTASDVLNSIDNCIKVSMFDAINQIQIDYELGSGQDFTISRGMGYLALVEIPEEPQSPDLLVIDSPATVNEGEVFQVTITCEANNIGDATVTFNGDMFLTNSDGTVSLTAPYVDSDTSYSITASKTNYQSAVKSITVKNQVTSIQLLSPNGGETWSDTHTIVWSISDIPLDPYAVTIQYMYSSNIWVTIVEDVTSEDNLYSWDTRTTSDGYPYKIKVILKADANGDGIYDTTISEDTSDGSFAVDNSVLHEGQIYGQVVESIDNPINNARVCVILSDEEGVVTIKCTFTDENGNYTIPVPAGNFTIEVSKKNYETSTIHEINVWPNEDTEVNFVLTPGVGTVSFPIFENENRDLIDESIKNRAVGGEITIQPDEDQIKYEKFVLIYNGISITPIEIKDNNISLLIDGDENSNGRTLVVNLAQGVFDFEENLTIEYDGEVIRMADNISDVLDPNNDGSHPEYLITIGANGIQILVSIPHFSEHQISIFSTSIQDFVEEIMRYKEITITAAIGVIAIAAVVMFRKGKEE